TRPEGKRGRDGHDCHAHARGPVPTQLSRVPGGSGLPLPLWSAAPGSRKGGHRTAPLPVTPLPRPTNKTMESRSRREGGEQKREPAAGRHTCGSRYGPTSEVGQGTIGTGGKVERGRISSSGGSGSGCMDGVGVEDCGEVGAADVGVFGFGLVVDVAHGR